MDLAVAWTLLLLVSAVWSGIIWPPFLRRVLKDERARDTDGKPTTFMRVHVILISISLALAAAVGGLGILTLI